MKIKVTKSILITELKRKRVTKNLKDEMELLEVRIKESQEELQRERAKVADVKKSGRVSKKTVEALKEETQRLQEKFINASNQLKRQADEIVQLEENVRATEEENRTLRMAAEMSKNIMISHRFRVPPKRKELEFSFKEKIEKSKIEMKGEMDIKQSKTGCRRRVGKDDKTHRQIRTCQIDLSRSQRINNELPRRTTQRVKRSVLEATPSKLRK